MVNYQISLSIVMLFLKKVITSSSLFLAYLLAIPNLIGAEKVHSIDVLSPVYTIDRLYKSMRGPSGVQKFSLTNGESSFPEVFWVTGYRAEVYDASGRQQMDQGFMCHTGLALDAEQSNKAFHTYNSPGRPLFTLAQGQNSIEFPKGFGLPMLSNEPLALGTQVLNHNIEGKTFQVRYKIKVDYLKDKEVEQPLKPLFNRVVTGMVSLEGRPTKFDSKDEHGSSCGMGMDAFGGHGAGVGKDSLGQKFSGHWVVPPGIQVNETRVTTLLDLPYDTTVHYIAVHLHPFAESVELRDETTGNTVFKSNAKNFKKKIGIDKVEHYSSQEGVSLFKDHEYSLVSTYNNSSGVPQDAMAEMSLYLLQKDFDLRVLTSQNEK